MATTTRRSTRSKPSDPVEDAKPTGLVPVSELLGDDESLVEAPLLELSLLEPVRPTVLLRTESHPDGQLYELAEMDDFDLLEQHRIQRDGDLFKELYLKRALNRDEKRKMKSLLEDLFQRALLVTDPDDDIRSKMKDGHKARVVLAFQTAPLARAMAQMDKAQMDKAQMDKTDEDD